MTAAEKAELYQQSIRQWRRMFALWPKRDLESRTAYWFEYVWVRGVYRKTRHDGEYFERWEYRGGKEAPEVKPCPPWMTPTKV